MNINKKHSSPEGEHLTMKTNMNETQGEESNDIVATKKEETKKNTTELSSLPLLIGLNKKEAKTRLETHK